MIIYNSKSGARREDECGVKWGESFSSGQHHHVRDLGTQGSCKA